MCDCYKTDGSLHRDPRLEGHERDRQMDLRCVANESPLTW